MATDNDQGDATRSIAPRPTSRDHLLLFKQGLYLGVKLKDRYVIEKELGRGGIGVVFLARDTQLLSKPVVIKILLEEIAESTHHEWFRKKFRQEVEALARIDHPGVVGILDAGELPDGKPYLVMQFVEGATLRSVIGPQGLPLERVAQIMRQIGHALSAAHDKGVCHRDLKPENIMLQTLGEGGDLVKLIDFGIAQVKDSQVVSNVATKVAGALPYMAPEQLRGQPVVSSDIYAMGVIAYELLVGDLPFWADSGVQLHEMQRAGVRVKPRDLRPELPEAAQQVILKALAFDAQDRYPRARDFGEELAKALATQEVPTGPVKSTSMLPTPTQQLVPEMAHVLFTDLVGYSKLPMNEQTRLLRQLQKIVGGTVEFLRAQEANQLISLPTGDGMALVFFSDPVAAVQCALEISRALQSHPEIALRMGVHSGPVYRIADINTNKNVAGGGINIAQRVMDCGDAGHILLSNATADFLRQMGNWAESLHDLGEHAVKHGVLVHLFNLYTSEFGNPAVPEKLRAPEPPKGEVIKGDQPKQSRLVPTLAIVALLLAVGIVITLTWRRPAPQPENISTPPAAAAPKSVLSYSVTLQRNPKVSPNSRPTLLPGEAIFGIGDRVRLNVTSPQSGCLYVINEGPVMKNGRPDYNILFPSPTTNGGSSQLAANQELHIPEQAMFILDNDQGAETVWMIWSPQSVAELEALKKWANPTDKGEIKDPAQISAVQEFLKQHSAAKPEVEKEKTQTKVRSNDSLMVHAVKLEHL